MPRNLVTIAFLAVVVVAALWLLDSPPPQFQSKPETKPDQLVLVQYFNDMETVQYDPVGQQEYRAITGRAEHRATLTNKSAQIVADQPIITLYQNGLPTWSLQADRSFSEQASESILLQDNVLVTQQAYENERNWTIETDKLIVDPDSQIADTDALVTIKSPGIVSRGEGMQADLRNETYEVLAKSQTRYAQYQ